MMLANVAPADVLVQQQKMLYSEFKLHTLGPTGQAHRGHWVEYGSDSGRARQGAGGFCPC